MMHFAFSFGSGMHVNCAVAESGVGHAVPGWRMARIQEGTATGLVGVNDCCVTPQSAQRGDVLVLLRAHLSQHLLRAHLSSHAPVCGQSQVANIPYWCTFCYSK